MVKRLIKSENGYHKALSRIESLMDAEAGTEEADELELLATLVELYEEQHFPMDMPTPLAAIRFRMEQLGLKQQDLVPFIGSRSKVSEVLSGKRPLSLAMMRGLHRGLGIPAEVLLQTPGAEFPNTFANLEWSQFPLKEMVRRGWIKDMKGIQNRAEEALRILVERAGGLQALAVPLLRQGVRGRLNAKANRYAVCAWCLRVAETAGRCPLNRPFQKGALNRGALNDIARLSYFDKGPLMAREYLAKNGVQLVVVPHLARTYLDGGAMLLPNRGAVVALTLRYDRLDNFWFSLLHELVHLTRHLSGDHRCFVDDLDLRKHESQSQDPLETEADDLASTALIPKRYWPQLDQGDPPSQEVILSLANELKVHPGIIAGRIRHRHANYRILSRLVGLGKVRVLFPEYSNENLYN